MLEPHSFIAAFVDLAGDLPVAIGTVAIDHRADVFVVQGAARMVECEDLRGNFWVPNGELLSQIGGERGNAALARCVGTDDGNTRRAIDGNPGRGIEKRDDLSGSPRLGR